jgi:hypothetical protein
VRLSASLERASGSDRRQHFRQPVSIGAGLGAAAGDRPSSPIVVVDLSTHGCGIELPSHVEKGARVWLKLPGLESWPARVVWAETGRAGLLFDRPLHDSVVARYAA